MTDIVEKAFEALRKLPPEQQKDLARFVLAQAQPVELTPEDAAAIAEAEAEIARGEYASPEEIKAFWKSRGV